jgi:hypothetical protein
MVTIKVINEEIKCPTFDTLYEQLSHHYALRDILKNPKRTVWLVLDDEGRRVPGKRTKQLSYQSPKYVQKYEESRFVDEVGRIHITVFESNEKLSFGSQDPTSEAGLVIKTEGTPLDLSLFGLEGREEALWFFGWVDCPGIARELRRNNFHVLTPNRNGLDWRYQYCKKLQKAVYEVLAPLVENKRQRLRGTQPAAVKETFKEKLQQVVRLLNEFAKAELEDLPLSGPRGSSQIESLTIRPSVAYALPGEVRQYSVYVPRDMVEELDARVKLELTDVVGSVALLDENEISLTLDPNHEELMSGRFSVCGDSEGSEALILARLGKLEDIAQFKVREPGSRRRRTLSGSSSSLLSDIEFNVTEKEPTQRISYTNGKFIIYLNFPPLSRYLSPDGTGLESPHGSLMVAELVAEAFARVIARRRLEAGLTPYIQGGEIDAMLSQMDAQMKKYLEPIHKALVVGL